MSNLSQFMMLTIILDIDKVHAAKVWNSKTLAGTRNTS